MCGFGFHVDGTDAYYTNLYTNPLETSGNVQKHNSSKRAYISGFDNNQSLLETYQL
jgi:hypothetical protein